MRVNRFAMVVCLWILAAPILAANQYGDVIDVERSRVSLQSERAVAQRCGVSAGCTRYDDLVFACECVPEGVSWTLRVHAHGRAQTVVSNLAYVTHEQAHVRDFIFLLEEHASNIKVRRFDTETQCQIDARAHMSRFPSAMRDLARRTTTWRDGVGHANRQFPRDVKRAAKEKAQ